MIDIEDLKQNAYMELCEIVDFFARDLFDVCFHIEISKIDFEHYKNGVQYYIFYSIGIYDYRNTGIKFDENNLIDIFEVETIKGILCFRNCFIRNDYLWYELNRVFNNLTS